MAKLQDLVDKLQMKVKGYKRQAEEAVRQIYIFVVFVVNLTKGSNNRNDLCNVNMTNNRTFLERCKSSL